MRRLLPARRRRRSSSPRDERGAAAVEFAFISLVLFTIVGGIIDYGLWFADSVSARQGVRDAARSSVLQTQSCAAPAVATAGVQTMACMAAQQVGPMGGNVWAKVVIPPEGWVRTKPLLVCVMVKQTGAVGLVPLPADRIIKAKTSMSIEVVGTTAPNGATPSASAVWPTTSPAPADWTWCA